jgi:hypothetical protein
MNASTVFISWLFGLLLMAGSVQAGGTTYPVHFEQGPEKSIISEDTIETVVAGKESISLKTSIKDDRLTIEALQNETCVDVTTQKYELSQDVKKDSEMPIFIAIDILMTTVGASLISLGAIGVANDYKQKLSIGGILVGGGLHVGGVIWLISATRDMKKKKKRYPKIEKMTSEERPCNKRPAVGIRINLTGELIGESNSTSISNESYTKSETYTATTDEHGRVVIPILETEKIKDFRFLKRFLTASCDKSVGFSCKPETVSLPPDLSAKLVLMHKDYDELKLWLDQYPENASAAQVKKEFDRLAPARMESERQRQEQMTKECLLGKYDACLNSKDLSISESTNGKCDQSRYNALQEAIAYIKSYNRSLVLISAYVFPAEPSYGTPIAINSFSFGEIHMVAIGYEPIELDVTNSQGYQQELRSDIFDTQVRIYYLGSTIREAYASTRRLNINNFEDIRIRVKGLGCSLLMVFQKFENIIDGGRQVRQKFSKH